MHLVIATAYIPQLIAQSSLINPTTFFQSTNLSIFQWWIQSTIPSINHASASCACEIRYVVPSLNPTSHWSQFHPFFHQSPEDRHGPSQCSTRPPATPRRSVVT